MKLNKIFLPMAALALVGAMTAGCSSDDLATDTPLLPDAAGGTVTMKTTITLDERASTRALDADGKKTFAAGDQIAVIYQNTSGKTVKAVSDALTTDDIDATNTQNATFSVSLTNPKANGKVRYIYPASRAAETVATTTAPNDDATIKYAALNTQNGTFDKIASDLDLSVFDGEMTAQAVLPAATLTNPLTIGAFTIKNSATSADVTSTITKLTIADGTNTYTVNPATLSTIYVAMKPIAGTQTVAVNAITDNNKYIKSVTGNSLAQNTMYPIKVSMTARYPLAVTDASVSSEDIGSVIGADGNIYLNAASADANGGGGRVVIAYVGSVPNYFEKFLAIAIEDATNYRCSWEIARIQVNTYASAHGITIGGTTYDSNTIGAGYHCDRVESDVNTSSATRSMDLVKGWRLPSVTDWRYIFDGLGRQKTGLTLSAKSSDGSTTYSSNATPTDPLGVVVGMHYYKDGNADALRAAINATCGNTALQSDGYWSSSKYKDNLHAWDYWFKDDGYFGADSKSSTALYVRPVFAY